MFVIVANLDYGIYYKNAQQAEQLHRMIFFEMFVVAELACPTTV